MGISARRYTEVGLSALKVPESKRLKLEQEKLLSNVAFDFNLCRYRWVDGGGCGEGRSVAVRGGGGGVSKVGQCRLTVSKLVLKAPMLQALETIIG
jgi:hypothetical protein